MCVCVCICVCVHTYVCACAHVCGLMCLCICVSECTKSVVFSRNGTEAEQWDLNHRKHGALCVISTGRELQRVCRG